MSRVTVFDWTGDKMVWAEPVEVEVDDSGRTKFWSPFEPVDRPGSTPGHFNNQQGIHQGAVLHLQDATGAMQRVEVIARPWSELGNKGRTFFEVR